jgi:hypothetical protein
MTRQYPIPSTEAITERTKDVKMGENPVFVILIAE